MAGKIYLLFDNDGTLLDSEPLAMAIVADYAVGKAKEQGIAVPRHDVLDLFGKTIAQILDITAEKHGVKFPKNAQDEVLAATVDGLAKHVQEVPGCRDFLAIASAWKASGAIADMAIVTSSEFNRVKPGLRRNELFAFFGDEHIFSANDTLIAAHGRAIPKPDPAIYNHVKQVLGITPDDIVITFEDSKSGHLSARDASITHRIGHLGGGHITTDPKAREAYAETLRDNGATHVIQHWKQAESSVATLIKINSPGPRPDGRASSIRAEGSRPS